MNKKKLAAFSAWLFLSTFAMATNLTNGGEDTCPVFDPSGTRIAYAGSGKGQRGLRIMDADGNHNTLVVPALMIQALAWSPNGEMVAVSVGNEGAIGTVDLKTGKLKKLDALGHSFVWLENGTKIGWIKSEGEYPNETYSPWIMNKDGSNQHALSGKTWKRCRMALSPDGHYVARVSNEHTADSTSDGPIVVESIIGKLSISIETKSYGGFKWSRDGRILYFMTFEGLMKVQVPDHMVEPTQVSKFCARCSNPKYDYDVSPDEKWVVTTTLDTEEPGYIFKEKIGQ